MLKFSEDSEDGEGHASAHHCFVCFSVYNHVYNFKKIYFIFNVYVWRSGKFTFDCSVQEDQKDSLGIEFLAVDHPSGSCDSIPLKRSRSFLSY